MSVRLLVFWMIVIFSLSAIPDMKILYWQYWLENEHHLFISDIDWKLVLSFNNPFFTIPAPSTLLQLDTFLHKLAHLIFYFILGWLAYRYARTVKKAFWICVTYALFDELHQAVTPGRYARISDVFIDIVAAILAILLYHWFTAPGRSNRAPKRYVPHKETRSAK